MKGINAIFWTIGALVAIAAAVGAFLYFTGRLTCFDNCACDDDDCCCGESDCCCCEEAD